jgi:outer membrane biosynthesis protein TonB
MEEELVPLIKYSKKQFSMRKGRGFSLEEIKKAGLNLDIIKREKIRFDPRRTSSYEQNIEILKSISIKPKKKPVIKEKQPVKKEKIIKKKKKVEKKEPVKEIKPKKEKKIEAKPKKVKAKVKSEIEIDKNAIKELTTISGLTETDAKKLIAIGVLNKKDLLEMAEDLDILSEETGISLTKMKKWISKNKK